MKGIPYLLEAFNKLPSTFNCHLLLIGRDMDNSQNMSIIKRGDSTKVHLLGFRKEVLPIVAACDVFVLSSIKGESITKSVIEAMSLEVTPIITDIAGNVELLEHEKSGLVVASKNAEDLSRAMRRVYEDQEWCKMLGKAAKLYVEQNLNTKQTVVKTKQLYEDLVKP
jgi:Glycosyltransferase